MSELAESAWDIFTGSDKDDGRFGDDDDDDQKYLVWTTVKLPVALPVAFATWGRDPDNPPRTMGRTLVECADAAVDRDWIFGGEDPDRVAEFLARADVRAAFVQLAAEAHPSELCIAGFALKTIPTVVRGRGSGSAPLTAMGHFARALYAALGPYHRDFDVAAHYGMPPE